MQKNIKNFKNKELILSRIKINEETGCWEPTLTKPKGNSSPNVTLDGKLYSMHRLAWEIWKEPILENNILLCVCKNINGCCNPSHYIVSTRDEIAFKRRNTKNKQYILDRIKINEITDCWEWTGEKNKQGYGRFKIAGKTTYAHRVAYELWVDHYIILTRNSFICHKCDNPSCVNPTHLFFGTPKDNMQDMITKNRQNHAFGEDQGLSKLTEVEVIQIRNLYSSGGYYQRELADMFNVSRQHISALCKKECWKHI